MTKTFEQLGLSEQLLHLLESSGIKEPSEIQEKAIPLVLQGLDVIGDSATGSGKTLAFGAGLIDRTEKGKGLQVLILTPTRELAEQIGKVLTKYSGFKNLKVSMVYGGVNIESQIREIPRAEIVVATPGRILDHIERGTINFSKLKTLVLDEADRMLDMGFIDDVERIIRECPKERQTLLFSATISADIDEIAKRHMKNPAKVSAEDYVDPEKLKQFYYDVDPRQKFSLLVHLLKKESSGLVMVFCNTRRNTEFIANNLNNLRMNALAIHGGLAQNKRDKIMKSFHEKNVYVLVCTDVAARGLDIKGVSHVYNYDIPKTSKEYLHRVGRTARAGAEGMAISIVSNRDYENFSEVMKDEEIKIEPMDLPEVQPVRVRKEFDSRRSGHDGRGGRSFRGDGGRRSSGSSGNRRDSRGRSFGGRDSHKSSRDSRGRGNGSMKAFHRF